MTNCYIALKGGEIIKYDEQVRLYKNDVVVLKDYRIKRKLTLHKSLRNKGFEIEINRRERGMANNQKLQDNITHTRSRIFELAYCNPWQLFITLTIDPQRYNRHDLKRYHRDLTHWIRNYNLKHHIKLKYLFIPELHKDKAWHMHGFIMGLPVEHLEINKNGFLDWPAYREKFGWCSLDKIRNNEAIAKYVTKYISKDLADCVKDLNANMYYCSQGLERAVEIKRGTLTAINVPWDYENEWIKCKWYDETCNDLGSLIQ